MRAQEEYYDKEKKLVCKTRIRMAMETVIEKAREEYDYYQQLQEQKEQMRQIEFQLKERKRKLPKCRSCTGNTSKNSTSTENEITFELTNLKST